MTIKETDTSSDEAMARDLQDQFRREVEAYASSTAWNNIHNVFTPDANNPDYGDASSEEVFQDACDIPVVDAIPENEETARRTPPPKQKKNYVNDLSFSTQSTSPSTSLDGSPFERSASVLSGPISIDQFVDVDIDLQREEEARIQRQRRKDEELARRLEREMNDELLARELRASEGFAVGVQTESDADLARRLQRESQQEARRRGLPPNSTRKQKIIYYGTRVLSVILVICVSYFVVMMVWGPNSNSALDPASW